MTNKKPKNANGRGKGNDSPNASSEGVYFLSISLENVRCFSEKQKLDLSDGNSGPNLWTIILSNNGTGKTTLLQAIAWWAIFRNSGRDGLPGYFGGPAEAQARSQIRLPSRGSEIYQSFVRSASSDPPGIDGLTGSRHPQGNPKGRDAIRPPQSGSDMALPIVCYGYGAARRTAQLSLLEGKPDTGTETLFSYHADLRNAEDWLLRADYAASKESPQQERQQERLEQIKQLLLDILPEIEDIQFLTGSGVYPIPRVEFHTPYGWVPLRQLGFGYQTVIAWMIDFASRMIERYPDSPDPLVEPAVVLIDEIDLHLHPLWQRQLIGYLSQHFPNTQFIATAHSPLIVQAATSANLAVLRRDGDRVVIDNDVATIRNWRIDQVLTSDLFGLPSARPPELDKLLDRRQALLTKARLTAKDKQELVELEKKIGPLPSGETKETRETLAFIKESLELLQREQATKP